MKAHHPREKNFNNLCLYALLLAVKEKKVYKYTQICIYYTYTYIIHERNKKTKNRKKLSLKLISEGLTRKK